MKSSVNKLIMIIWCFCLASFIFAEPQRFGDRIIDRDQLIESRDDKLRYAEWEEANPNYQPIVINIDKSEDLYRNYGCDWSGNTYGSSNITVDGGRGLY